MLGELGGGVGEEEGREAVGSIRRRQWVAIGGEEKRKTHRVGAPGVGACVWA